jgi:uncharacterized membrane protein
LINLNKSIWFDEAYSAYLARLDYSDIVAVTARDLHPPLYYILLKAWSGVFGHSIVAMRLLSTAFGVVTIAFIHRLIKTMAGIRASALAALAISIMPLFVYYGQEMRMYTMMTAIVFAASYVLVVAVERATLPWWTLYGALVALGMWTHYFVVFVWIAHLCWLVWRYRREVLNRSTVIAYATALLLFAPWLPTVVRRFFFSEVENSWVPPLSLSQIVDFVGSVFFARQMTRSPITVAMAAVIVVVGYYVVRNWKSLKNLELVVLMAVVPVLALLALSVFRPEFVERYLLPSAVSAVIVSVLSLRELPVKQLAASCLVLALCFGAFAFRAVTGQRADGDMAQFARDIAAASGSSEEVILSRVYRAYYDLSFYDTGHVLFLSEFVQDEPTWGYYAPPMKDDLDIAASYEALLADGFSIWEIAPDGFVPTYPDRVVVITEIGGPVGLHATKLQLLPSR